MTAHDDSEIALALFATGILTSLLIGGFIFWLYWSDRRKGGSSKKSHSSASTSKKNSASAKRKRKRPK